MKKKEFFRFIFKFVFMTNAISACIFISILGYLAPFSALAGPIKNYIKNKIVEKKMAEPPPTYPLWVSENHFSGLKSFSFEVNDEKRFFTLFVPEANLESPPLWIVLHGGGGSMSHLAKDDTYGLISFAKEKKIILVFPNGNSQFPSGEFATWNAGRCCGFARDQKKDDVLFIKNLIIELKKTFKVNSKKIVIAGMSNGAMMAYRLACEIPDFFTHLAAVSGTDNTENCSPSKMISLLHIHALDDDHVLYKGGSGKAAVNKSLITDFKSVPDTILKWSRINHCKKYKNDFIKNLKFSCDLHSDCDQESKVQLCHSETGGHSWPGSKKFKIRNENSGEFSANEIIWDFTK